MATRAKRTGEEKMKEKRGEGKERNQSECLR